MIYTQYNRYFLILQIFFLQNLTLHKYYVIMSDIFVLIYRQNMSITDSINGEILKFQRLIPSVEAQIDSLKKRKKEEEMIHVSLLIKCLAQQKNSYTETIFQHENLMYSYIEEKEKFEKEILKANRWICCSGLTFLIYMILIIVLLVANSPW